MQAAEKYCVQLGGRMQQCRKRDEAEEELRLERQRRALKLLRFFSWFFRIPSDCFETRELK